MVLKWLDVLSINIAVACSYEFFLPIFLLLLLIINQNWSVSQQYHSVYVTVQFCWTNTRSSWLDG